VVQGVVGVDPDGTRLEGVGDLDGGVEVLGVQGGGEAVGGGVAELDGLLLGLELGDRADRAEDLLLHDLHVFCDVGEDGGLDEVALVTLALAASLDGGTGVLACLDVPGDKGQFNSSVRNDDKANLLHDAVELDLGNLRALESVGGEGVANNVLLCALLELLHEVVVDALLDVDTSSGAASLAVVEEDTKVDPRDGVVNVSVLEDDVGRLATELEGDLLQVGRGGGLEDCAADDGGTGEGDLVDVHVRGKRGTSDLTETGDDVDNTRGEASLLDECGSDETTKRGLFGGLQDDCVTASNGRADLPCPHEQGEVPGNDLGAD
jgi:hypothetical protein